MEPKIKLIECPRDAMQGISEFIPTQDKTAYLNLLLKVGFHTIDFGSFVSPKAIPQMRDTAQVLSKLDFTQSKSRLLAIIANERGAHQAASYDEIRYLGYPFSISETFQIRNTNATIAESVSRVEKIQEICISSKKSLVIYISMGFGNPYGDPWNAEIAMNWVEQLANLGISIFSLSDTIGVSTGESIRYLFSHLIPAYPQIEFGAHLHTVPDHWKPKIEAAYQSGCRRFDGALKGYGGCPMAKEELTGNMPTEKMINYFSRTPDAPNLNPGAFIEASDFAAKLFGKYQ